MTMLVLLLLAVITAAVAFYLWRIYTKFTKAGVNRLPFIPILGHMTGIILKQEHSTDVIARAYDVFPDDRFFGHYEFLTPIVLIRDLELVKKVGVKDFEYFLDRRTFFDAESDPLFGRSLISLKGKEWRDMRSTLSPAFTSSKMRQMVPFMMETGERMVASIKKRIQTSKTDYIDLEGKDLVTRYASDVIASCAFGVVTDSQEDDNYFYKMCKDISKFHFIAFLKIITYISFPWLMKKLKVALFTKEMRYFIIKLVTDMMRHREKNHIVRNDMIQLLIEVKKGQLSHDAKSTEDADAGFATVQESAVGKKIVNREWSDEDLIAQASPFLFAGVESVSTEMAYLLHEMALNPDIQGRLAREIKENHEKNNGTFDYTSVQQMKYLDMVVSEVLRRWPGSTVTDRLCVKDYNLGKPNGKATKDYIIRKGEIIQLPIWSFSHDPQYFPDPYKFDPERFSDENKHRIVPLTYMPFGVGPRNCIGSRFALCEIKVMAYQLLLNLEVMPCEKTITSPRLSANGFSMDIEGGHWVRLKIRRQ